MIKQFRLYMTARVLHFLIKFSPVEKTLIAGAFIAVAKEYKKSKNKKGCE